VSLPQSGSNAAKQRSDNKKLIQLSSWSDVAGHFSGVSKGALRDWFFTSVNSGDDSATGSVASWRPYKAEILMINVVTGEVRRLAHHRSRSLTSNYYYNPRLSASFDGSVVTWASNFGYASGGYVDIYAMRVDGAGGATPPPPPPDPTPTPSAVNVSFSNPASGATVSGTVSVTTAASGGSGSGYTYTVKAGTATIYTGTNTTFSWNTTSAANGSVTLSATATDSAGASGAATRTVTVANTSTPPPPPPPGTTPPPTGGDTTPPVVRILSPSGNVWTGNSIRVAASATDNAALSKIELWGAGRVFATLPCSGTSCAGENWWSTGSLATAAYQVHAVAVDAAGNRTVSAPVMIYKDATSPTVASGATGGSTPPPPTPPTTPPPPTPSPTGDTTPPVARILSPSGNVWTGNSILVAASATDDAALSKIELWGAGQVFATLPCSSTSCFGESRWSTGALPAGAYQVNAVAVDAAGNRTVSAAVTIYKDATSPAIASGATGGTSTPPPPPPPPTGGASAPTVRITKPWGTVWTGNSIRVSATASDDTALSRIEFWGAGQVFAIAKCSGRRCGVQVEWATRALPPGAYTVNAVVFDADGNRTVSAPVTIIKDAPRPSHASGA
jgi:hypothetical protein